MREQLSEFPLELQIVGRPECDGASALRGFDGPRGESRALEQSRRPAFRGTVLETEPHYPESLRTPQGLGSQFGSRAAVCSKNQRVAGCDCERPATWPTRQTAICARPLRRRPLRTERPARVLMRVRKPCVLWRRRLFGWYVRFVMITPIDGRRICPCDTEFILADSRCNQAC